SRVRSATRSRLRSCCRTNACRVTRPTRASPNAATATGGSGRRSWMQRLPRSSCRTTSITGGRRRAPTPASRVAPTLRTLMKLIRRLLVAVLVVGLLAGAGGGWLLYRRIHEPYRSFDQAEQFVDIPAGSGARAIGNRLAAAGVVRDPLTCRAALWLSGRARDLKAGEYRFEQPATTLEVID